MTSKTKEMRISELFSVAVDLCLELGASSIKDLPGGIFEHAFGEVFLAINGRKREGVCSKEGVKVPPFGIFFELRGFPAGWVCMSGGIIVNDTETELIALLKAETERIKQNNGGNDAAL
jgi:hypothetical protein